jgi:DNA-binding transcriptional MerR regulator
MTIGELARAVDVNVQTIRYYEREGLLAEAHRWRDSGYRDYDGDALLRLRFIRSAKELGFTLREIKELLDMRLPGRIVRGGEAASQGEAPGRREAHGGDAAAASRVEEVRCRMRPPENRGDLSGAVGAGTLKQSP